MPLTGTEALILAAILDVHGPAHLRPLADRLAQYAADHAPHTDQEDHDG